MESYLLYMLVAAVVGAFLAELCKLIIDLLSKKNRKKKLSFSTRIKNLFHRDAMPFGTTTTLAALTMMAHAATYAGSSMYAGYNFATSEAIPFFILLAIDVIFIIFEIVGFVKDKTTRKSRAIGIIAGVILGTIVAALTLKICIDLGCRMPWYGG